MERQFIQYSEQKESMNIEQIKELFNSIIQQINENNNLLSDKKFMKEILELIIHINDEDLSNSIIINHRIFVIIRDYYLILFQHWHNDENIFDEISCWIFETISNLFLKMSSHLSENCLRILKDLLFDSRFLDEINRFLEDLSINKKSFDDPQIKILDNFIRTIQRLERIDFDNKKDYLFNNLIKCICSPTFIHIFFQSVNQDNENFGQKFLLNTCTDYIYSHSIDKQHQQSLIYIRQTLLHPFTQWINQQSSNFRSWSNRIIIILRQISFLLTLSIQLNRYLILEKEIFDDYCQLIDSFLNILYSITQSDNSINNNNNKLVQSLIGTLIPNLSTMTLSNQLEKYFQTKHITFLILKLIDFNNDEIQLNVFKILSSITIEQDTRNILYSNNLTKNFIKFLNKIIDDSNQTLRFYNLLRCLKNLIQYEQIKEEFVKENGLSLILRCLTETKLKSIQIQQPTLEILLSLTFNKEAFQQLKQNLNQLKSCLSSSSHQGILNILQYILWKLETKEENILSKSIINNKSSKYDLILSYSYSDHDLCFRIYEQLLKDNFRIWIDQNENNSTTIYEKCQIIDSCQYFLICLSDSYKQNLYCRCESTYAYEHECQLIPLIVTSNYRPDGWLNRLISGKISIDFTRLEFDVAHIKLKNEIDRQRKYFKNEDFQSNEISTIKNEYPSKLDQWTNEDIKLFLMTKNLNSLLPLFNEMNGNLLYDLYRMCLSNRESMFHTLKNELSIINSSSNQPLTLIIYLRFLNEIEKYIPSIFIDQK